jgi:hypothetical protein
VGCESPEMANELRRELTTLIKHPRLTPSPECADGMIGTLASVVLAFERRIPYSDASKAVGIEYQRLLREIDPSGRYRLLCQINPWDCVTPWPRAHGDSEEDVGRAFKLVSERYRELCDRLGVALCE